MAGQQWATPAGPVWVIEGAEAVLYVDGEERIRSSPSNGTVVFTRSGAGGGEFAVRYVAGRAQFGKGSNATGTALLGDTVEADDPADADEVGLLVLHDGSRKRVKLRADSGDGTRTLYVDA